MDGKTLGESTKLAGTTACLLHTDCLIPMTTSNKPRIAKTLTAKHSQPEKPARGEGFTNPNG